MAGTTNSSGYAAIILAAGASSRMGEPKALLPYQQTNFLQHIYTIAHEVFHDNVWIVIGAAADKINEMLPDLSEKSLFNPDWEKGMGTSIALGTNQVLKNKPGAAGILFLTVDQPFITRTLLETMVNHASTNPASIIASAYDDSPGIPALFPSGDFSALMQLNGAQGAKKIMLAAGSRVIQMDISNAATDIDTPEQYRTIIGKR